MENIKKDFLYHEFMDFFFKKNNIKVEDYNSDLCLDETALYFSPYRKEIKIDFKAKQYNSNSELSDKLNFYKFCLEFGFKTPKTRVFSGKAEEFPTILKKRNSSQGKDVHLILSKEDLLKMNISLPEQYILQEPIKSSFGTDYRVLLANKKAIGAIKRTNKTDFRANLAQGGKAEPAVLPDWVISECERFCSTSMNLGIIGLDLIEDDGKFLFIEMNPRPAVKTIFSLYPGSIYKTESLLLEFIKTNNINKVIYY